MILIISTNLFFSGKSMKLVKVCGNLPVLEVSVLSLLPPALGITYESFLNFTLNYLYRSPIINSPYILQQIN